MNEHKCPVCGRTCNCDEYMLYGDCYHDCEGWRIEAKPAGVQQGIAEPDDYFEEGE